MVSPEEEARWPGRIAVAVRRGDVPEVFLAESEAVLGRLVALRLVARTSPEAVSDPELLIEIRRALLEERWADAVVGWMHATGETVDAYPDERLWNSARLDADYASMEIRLSPIFEGR